MRTLFSCILLSHCGTTWEHGDIIKKRLKKKPERADHEQTDVVNNSAD